MALLYSPPSPHGHQYYEASQLVAFAIYVGLLLAQGYQRGYPWRRWLPMVAASTLALIVGCQLVCLPVGDWLSWLAGDAGLVRLVAEGPRSAVGGAAASLVAVVALRRALGFRGWAVLDAFAAPLCWALVAQCVGCVLTGCCWGEVTTGGLGLVYGPGTLPYVTQQMQGLLPTDAAHSLPLVPTQAYNLLLCLGTGLVLLTVRRRAAGWPGGSRYLLAMGLLVLGRFTIEFWRDPAGEPLGAAPLTLAGCTLMRLQWLLLLESLVLLGSWAGLVWHGQRVAQSAENVDVTPLVHPVLVGLGLLLVTSRLGAATLTTAEVVVLQALLLAVLVAEAWAWLPVLGQRAPRLVGLPLSLLLGGALLLATAQAPAPQHTPPPAEAGPGRNITFSVGSIGNQFDDRPSSGCSSSRYVYGHRNRAAGAEVAYQWAPDSARRFVNTVGGGVWAGSDAIETFPANSQVPPPTAVGSVDSKSLYDVHIYTEGHRVFARRRLDMNYRLGLHVGQLKYQGNDGSNVDSRLLPELMFAFGSRPIVFGQVDLGYGAENALGNYTSRLAIGSGLGQRYGSTVLLGYANGPHYTDSGNGLGSMAFVSANLRLPGNSPLSDFSLEPYYSTDFGRHYVYSIKLHYQLRLHK